MKLFDRQENGATVLELKGNISGSEDRTVFYKSL
jgi:hypothetical protein